MARGGKEGWIVEDQPTREKEGERWRGRNVTQMQVCHKTIFSPLNNEECALWPGFICSKNP